MIHVKCFMFYVAIELEDVFMLSVENYNHGPNVIELLIDSLDVWNYIDVELFLDQ